MGRSHLRGYLSTILVTNIAYFGTSSSTDSHLLKLSGLRSCDGVWAALSLVLIWLILVWSLMFTQLDPRLRPPHPCPAD